MTAERDRGLDELDAQAEELIELSRRASREGWTIDELERALSERLAVMHRMCMEWLRKNQCTKDLDRRSDDDPSP